MKEGLNGHRKLKKKKKELLRCLELDAEGLLAVLEDAQGGQGLLGLERYGRAGDPDARRLQITVFAASRLVALRCGASSTLAAQVPRSCTWPPGWRLLQRSWKVSERFASGHALGKLRP